MIDATARSTSEAFVASSGGSTAATAGSSSDEVVLFDLIHDSGGTLQSAYVKRQTGEEVAT